MKLIDIERRLARIEVGRISAPPTAILTDRPEGDGPEIRLEDWQAWATNGLGTVSNGVFTVLAPEMTPEQWMERHVTLN